MADYSKVHNTSVLENSVNNASFISQVPRNDDYERRLEADHDMSMTKSPEIVNPNFHNEIPNRRAGIDLVGTTVAERRLTLIAARQRPSVLKSRQSVRRTTNPMESVRKKDSTRERMIIETVRALKYIDVFAALLAVSSGIIVYNENEVYRKDKTYKNIDYPAYVSDPTCTVLRFFNLFVTAVLCIFVVVHYILKLRLLKLKKLRLQEDNIKSAGMLPGLIIELFICAVFCPPKVDFYFSGDVLLGRYTYSVDSLVSIVTLGKSYLVLKLYGHFSPWTSDRSAKICAKYKCQASVGFAVKAELKKRPYLMLGILMMVTILYLGFAIRTFEISFVYPDGTSPNFDFSYLLNAFWLTIITMTTVGFGEGYPNTHLGRTIGVMSCVIGMLLVSLMVVSLTVASEFTAEESKAFYILKRIYANDNAKEKAANVIKTIFRLRKALKAKNSRKLVEKFVMLAKLKKQISTFKNDYRIANAQNLPIDEMLKNLQEKLESDINDIKREVMIIPELDTRCGRLKDRQGRISTRLDEVIKIQGSIAEYMLRLNEVKKQK